MPISKHLAPRSSGAPPVRTVLVAVLGSTPAVLTETLWALAHESEPVVPDTVVVVTTAAGREILHRQLIAPVDSWRSRTVWQSLRSALLGRGANRDPRLQLEPAVVIFAPDTSRGTMRPLDDIRTASDNAAAAETILQVVRRFTTDPDTRVIGLLAGGRKTMGALLHAALSLSGRKGDRLLHVLVNEPFDHPKLVPPFYFPGQPGPSSHRVNEASAIPNADARIEIADVPLVALGELVSAKTGSLPATFASLSRAADEAVDNANATTSPLSIHYDVRSRTLSINAYSCEIPAGRPAAFCAALIDDARKDEELGDRGTLESRWSKVDPKTGARAVAYQSQGGKALPLSKEDISNALNVVRETLLKKGDVPGAIVERLFPRRAPIGLNRDGVTII